ncbi:MAG: IgGFc-binding protein, partial [Candidatus Kapaibacterium sp.]
MKKTISYILALLMIALGLQDIAAQDKKIDPELRKKIVEAHLTGHSQGRKFIIAAPPNDRTNATQEALEIYVASSVPTTFTVAPAGSGGQGGQTYTISQPMDVEVISTANGRADWSWEVWDDETVTDKGVFITSPTPISVYYINSKYESSDGYLAIPVSNWGTDYIHCAYYDYGDYTTWAGGFVIVAAEDDTDIRIFLRGKGADYAGTVKGKKIGETVKISLNAGQTYLLRGDGTTEATFDLSGTRIISDKPIGLMSFHNRTVVPKAMSFSRDYLIEMMPPVTSWGKEYCSIELKRKDMGDLFRVVASEDNTKIDIEWFDFETKQRLGSRNFILEKDGDWHDILETDHEWPHENPSIKGTSVFRANKPIMVMQYSYSRTWDGDMDHDPFMFLVTAVEQYIPGTVFQVPMQDGFLKNYFNLIAVGDTTDPSRADLRSIKIKGKGDWEYIADMQPNFPYNQIPGTNLFWARLTVNPGAHRIISEGALTKFGGYVYGFKTVDSYGWPAAMAFYNLEETDTLEPEIFIEGECGVYDVRITEKRNGKEGDDPLQRDEGVIEQPVILEDYSYNFKKIDLPVEMFDPSNHDFTFQMEVVDLYADAFCIFSVSDIRGNVNSDSIRYEADSLLLDPEVVDFGDQRLLTTEYLDVILKSASDSLISIESIELQSGDYYFIESGGTPPSFELSPRGEHTIRIGYYPERNSFDPEDLDIDSLIIETECLEWKWEIKGRGIAPEIIVGDFHAGIGEVDAADKCVNDVIAGKGLKVVNPGSEPLIVTGYSIEGGAPMHPFTVSDPLIVYDWDSGNVIDNDGFPFTVGPRDSVYLRSICYQFVEVRNDDINILFESNAVSGDNKSNWTGGAVTPGPVIEGFNFDRRRVGSNTVCDTAVKFYNIGSSTIKIRDFIITDDDGNAPGTTFEKLKAFKYDAASGQKTEISLPGSDMTVPAVVVNPDGDTVFLQIVYNPGTEEQHDIRVVPHYHDPDDDYEVTATVKGEGYLPKIDITDYSFEQAFLVNETHPETGTIDIMSTSSSSELKIYSIEIDPDYEHADDFEILNMPDLTQPLVLGMLGDPDDTFTLRVSFTPSAINERYARIKVVSDAAPGNETVDQPRNTIYGMLDGKAIDQGAQSDPVDFGDIMRCETKIDSVWIKNESLDGDMTITAIRMLGDYEVFNPIREPDIVPAGEEAYAFYEFIPANAPKSGGLAPQTYTAPLEIDVQFQSGKDTMLVSSILTGTTHLQQVDFSLRDLSDVKPTPLPGSKTEGKYSFPVYTQCTNWNDADIKSLELEIIYNSRWMRYDGSINKGPDMQGDWDISAVEEDL